MWLPVKDNQEAAQSDQGQEVAEDKLPGFALVAVDILKRD